MDVRYDLGDDHRLVDTLCPDMKMTPERPGPDIATAVTGGGGSVACGARAPAPPCRPLCSAWVLLTVQNLDATTLVRVLSTRFGQPA
ncbi:hypothetical protein ACIGAN_06315 [Streptomyces sp. NPDC085931]|uniref:hypothetical protein n=1 Tax=Streptomyces sp. NPDC085931 TaxID=3365740 RepID=UPI0037D50D61